MATLDTISGIKVKSYSVSGPASYATGGFLQDASADFSWIGFVDVIVTTRGSLPPCDFETLHNKTLAGAEALGQAVIKVVRGRYDKATMGLTSGVPGSVSTRSVKFAAASTTGAAHTHTFDHDHAAVTSPTETAAGTLGILLAAGGGNMRNHTHSFDVANLAATSSSTSHTHDRSFEYDHSHAKTVATVDISAVELASTTNISATTFTLVVYGFGKT